MNGCEGIRINHGVCKAGQFSNILYIFTRASYNVSITQCFEYLRVLIVALRRGLAGQVIGVFCLIV